MGFGHDFPRAVTHAPTVATVATVLRAILALLALAILAGLTCGCDPVREGVMRVTRGVPDPGTCAEGTAACIRTDAGMIPAQCDHTRRLWPSTARRPDGTRRTCAGCAVLDLPDAGQHAVCLDAVDGGAP